MGAVAGTSSRCAIDASPDADGLRPHRASYRGRHGGRGKGRFLVLGSASIDLLRQASESLAGRIRYLELGPLDADEVGRKRLDALWLRGGFPESLLAAALARALAVDAKTIASLIATAPGGTEAHFFRTAAGAEIDLLLKFPGQRKPWAIEIKRGLAPRLERGFHLAGESGHPERRLVVYGGKERFPLAANLEAVSLNDRCEELSAV